MRLRAQVPGLREGVRVVGEVLVDAALGREKALDALDARLVQALGRAPVWPAELVQVVQAPRLVLHARVRALADGGWLDTPRAAERLAAGDAVVPVGPEHVWTRADWDGARGRMVEASANASTVAALVAALVEPITRGWANVAARFEAGERFLERDAWHLPEVEAHPGGHLVNFLERCRVVASALIEESGPVDPLVSSLSQVLSGARLGASPPALTPRGIRRVADWLAGSALVTGTGFGDVAWLVGHLLAIADRDPADEGACVDSEGRLTKMLRGQAVGSRSATRSAAGLLREELIDLLAFNGLVFARGDVPIALWRQAQGGLPRTDHR